jgi:cobalt/nickel transport system permease protein
MAIVGAIPGIILHFLFKNKSLLNNFQKDIFIFFGSWISIVLASFFCSLELGLSGTISLLKVMPAMVGIHSIIGIFEGIITVVLFSLLFSTKNQKSEKLSIGISIVAALIIGLVLSPFANGFPDGLEWVAEKYAFLHESAPYFVSPLADYTFPINNEILATGFAGLLGVIITFVIVLGLGFLLKLNMKKV